MAFQKKKKPPVLSREEQESIRKRLEDSKRFFKPVKGEFTFKNDESSQEVVETGRYYLEEDIKKTAEERVAEMNKASSKHWSLISWRVLGREEMEEDKTSLENQ